jgi:transcriptional regulator with PAS, ATPase and Fis domain
VRAVGVLDAARGFAAVFEDRASSGLVVSVGLPGRPGLVEVAADPFVLDICRAASPLARARESVLSGPSESAAGVPLVVRGRVIGVLVVLCREARGEGDAPFDEEDRRFLGSLAALGAPALDSVRQLRALAVDVDRLREENRALKGALEVDEVLIGDSAPMRRVKDLVVRASASSVGVLVRGESGTGKELVAKLLHGLSPRREAPFLAVNCAAVPETLLESELFGIERGVATGVDARPGRFELASGGTIFLDEIADAPLSIQAKLLRVLQDKQIERVGGRQQIPVDVRIVSATNANLGEAIRERRFREDLYYRIRVVEVALPPLRERREDIPRLVGHFLSRISARDRRPPLGLSRDAVAALLAHPFPGNVRELENLLEGAAALIRGDVIEAADLQIRRGGTSERSSDSRDLASLERDHIRRVLEDVKGNKSEAARILGINRRTLYRKDVAN